MKEKSYMKLARDEIAARVKRNGIIAIVRGGYELPELLGIGHALLAGSLRVIEVTLNTPRALEVISALRSRFGEELLVGAGTVRTHEQFNAAVAAGALFTVAPSFDPATVACAREVDVLHMPGVFTATETQAAFAAGCRMLKLFPCETVGPAYLRALRAPFDDVEFVPTGGIDLDNIGLYAQAGAVAVGIGSALIPKSGWSEAEITSRSRALQGAWLDLSRRPVGSA
jgi:2-dehydro-3-deoxyphosphogluconate aldolase / (4S)-4-hydroxy-2-oxoglutarate aldolase